MTDLAPHEGAQFAGILTAKADIGRVKSGVNSAFLENAEDYFSTYQGFNYWKLVFEQAIANTRITDPRLIVEFGAGFGNATLPLLELFPRAHVVATDISPNLLTILNRLLGERGLADRCTTIAMDAHRDHLRGTSADLVVGAAILHHLVDPASFIARALELLKTGGCAIFAEPFEAGNAIFRLICTEIGKEAARRGETSPGIDLLTKMPDLLAPQIFRETIPGWRERDDKWVFTRSYFEGIRRELGAQDLTITPLHGTREPFTHYARSILRDCQQLADDALPTWAWEIIGDFETKYFSPDLLAEFIIEGYLTIRK